MDYILRQMFNSFDRSNDISVIKNIIKEIIQEVTLSGIARTDFFKYAAFNGGTALRIFHNVDRFSEDLDFSVDFDKADKVNLNSYENMVNKELESLNIPCYFDIESKDGIVKRAYVRGNLREVLNAFEIDQNLIKSVSSNETIKVKFEVDTAPLMYASFETRYMLRPYPVPIRIYDSGSLFAGKISAVISRGWKNRVKGRDLYDYIFYISNNYPINMKHLENRLKFSGNITDSETLDVNLLKKMLIERFNSIDYESAKMDILPFVKDTKMIDYWNKDLFIGITENYRF